MHNCISKVILAIFVMVIVQARVYEMDIPFTGFKKKNSWIFLDKMTFQPGFVEIMLQTRTEGQTLGSVGQPNKFIIFQVIPQQLWDKQQQLKCKNFPTSPHIHNLPRPNTDREVYPQNTRLKFQINERKLYYFVLRDCGQLYLGEYQNRNLRLFVRLTLLNNGQELGQQQDHWYIYPLIIITGTWLVYFNKDGVRTFGRDTDWPTALLFIGIATNMSSLTWRAIGHFVYWLSGTDFLFFHIIYLFMHSVSQCFVIGLIMLIGFGWSINYMLDKQLAMWTPVMAMLGLINIMTTLLTKINNKQHDRHHMFDSIPGFLLIIYRISLIVIFTGSVIYTHKISRFRIKQFLINFFLLGFGYLSALPLLLVVARYYIDKSDQNQFVFVGVEAIKTICNVLLTYILNAKKSQYQSVAYKNASFLPDEPKFR